MNRRGKRESDSKKNISINILCVMIVIAIVTFMISYMLYSNKTNNKSQIIENKKLATASENKMINIIDNTTDVSSSIGKKVNELEDKGAAGEEIKVKEENKVAINTSAIDKSKKVENKIENNKNKKEEKSEKEKIENKEENKVKNDKKNTEEEKTITDFKFIKPVEGEKVKDYSKDNLVYSKTLNEWTTHKGIDYLAEKTDIVKAAADGKIKSIKNDPRYGLTVVIEHENGFESIYSSLLTTEFVKVGEDVKQGQTIATVGNTARFEIADETHIHFEIKKDGENVDPNIYIK